ncbi:hypothetical protein [Actinocrispum wychmicini]|uniref:hypothetical protein n=1 Tax=Actinocrispum wychmicini TaxID=1213861 RepID=UPI0010452237|nr:hypothetical protein [Actinocrispum wychmicini]
MSDTDAPLPQSMFRRYLDPLAATITESYALNHALSANSAVLDAVVDNARRAGVPVPTLIMILKTYGSEYLLEAPAATAMVLSARPLAPSRLVSHTATLVKVLDEQTKIMARMSYLNHVAHAMLNNARSAGIADYLLYDFIEELHQFVGPNPDWDSLHPVNFQGLEAEHRRRVRFRAKEIRPA